MKKEEDILNYLHITLSITTWVRDELIAEIEELLENNRLSKKQAVELIESFNLKAPEGWVEPESTNIPGEVNIPLAEITEEEAAMDITLERLNEYSKFVQKDFVESFDNITNPYVFGGFLLGKLPREAKPILNIINAEGKLTLQDYQALFDSKRKTFYGYLCEQINLTEYSKKRVNQMLFSVKKYFENAK